MDRKKIIILIVVAAIIALVIFLLWFFWPKGEPVPVNVNPPAGAAPQSLDQLPPASPERQAQEKNYPLGLRELAFSKKRSINTLVVF